MNVVYLIPKDVFEQKLDRDRFAAVNAIKRHLRTKQKGNLVYSGPGWHTWDVAKPAMDNLKTIFPNIEFDLAILYHMHDVKGVAELPIIKVMCCSEMYCDRILHRYRLNNPDYLILHHTVEEERVREVLKVPTYHIPHGCDHTQFHPNPDVAKSIDFTLIGRLDDKVYPLRSMFYYKVIPRLRTLGYTCYIHRHPGYKLKNPNAAVQNYIRAIQKSKIVLTCSSMYKYRLCKYGEVPMCGSALAADLPHDGADFFKSFLIEINPTWSVDRIVATLIDALPRWTQYATIGRQLTLESFKQTDYADRFLSTYEQFCHEDGGPLKGNA